MHEQYRASHDMAPISVWFDIIKDFPEFKTWAIYNKTIPIEVLEVLARDDDSCVRSAVAMKRSISESIVNLYLSIPTKMFVMHFYAIQN